MVCVGYFLARLVLNGVRIAGQLRGPALKHRRSCFPQGGVGLEDVFEGLVVGNDAEFRSKQVSVESLHAPHDCKGLTMDLRILLFGCADLASLLIINYESPERELSYDVLLVAVQYKLSENETIK